MKELELGLDGVLPIMEFDLVNKPICLINSYHQNDMYMLYSRNNIYRFKRISIVEGAITFAGLFDYGDNKNIYKCIEYCKLHIIGERNDYKIVQFDSMQELYKYYHNQIKE